MRGRSAGLRHASFGLGSMLVVLSCLFLPATASAVTFGQVDDFQDGTVENWDGAAGFFQTVGGGQGGAGDLYLEVTGDGGVGAGSRIATYNQAQWSGNYLAAGVSAIEVDMANFGPTDLEMRAFLMFGSGGDWTTTAPLLVPADGLWRPYVFGLTAADLTHVGGAGSSLDDTLSNLPRLMLRHQSGDPGGLGEGTPVLGTLGIDNITAVPEPASLLVVAAGGLGVLRRRR